MKIGEKISGFFAYRKVDNNCIVKQRQIWYNIDVILETGRHKCKD